MRKIKFKIVKHPGSFYYCLYVKIGFFNKWESCITGYLYEASGSSKLVTDTKNRHYIVRINPIKKTQFVSNAEDGFKILRDIKERGFLLQNKNELTFYPGGVLTPGF